MAFKLIPLEATGSFQSLFVRNIEDPLTIDLTDTPTFNMPNGVPQTGEAIGGYLTGSLKSIVFDSVDDWIYLPAQGGYDPEQSNLILDNIGQSTVNPGKSAHGVSATNVSVDLWVKMTVTGLNISVDDLKTTKMWEFTVQRDSQIEKTEGIDGVYTGRIIYTQDPAAAAGTSAHFVEFLYASADTLAWSLTSNNSLESTEGDWLGTPSGGSTGWNHICCVYEAGAAPDNGGDPTLTPNDNIMKIYINGDKDKESTVYDLENTQYDVNTPYPSYILPATYYDDFTWAGRLDELRFITATGNDSAYRKLSLRDNIGRSFDTYDPIVDPDMQVYSPTGDHIVAWWGFDSVSAIDLFAGTPNAILDQSRYEHHGTAKNFEGSISFNTDLSIFMGLSASGDLIYYKGGTVDHGGQFLLYPQDDTIKLESGSRSILTIPGNVWASTGAATVINEDKNIYFGSSAVRVNSSAAYTGARHTIPYNPYIYDDNYYTLHLKLLSLSGSPSAKISFTIGETTNTLSTTAYLERAVWESVYLRHKAIDPNENRTGTVDVVSLGSDALFLVDGLHIHQGQEPITPIIPEDVRYGGEVNWKIED